MSEVVGLKTSESVVKIGNALLVAQKQIDAVSKQADNPYFKSKYADLSAVMGAVKGPLNDNNIVILQVPTPSAPGTLALTTRLQHTSGEFIEGTAVVPLSKEDPQAYGSAITYARRYSLQAVIGLLAEDDDGNAASGRPTTSTPKAFTPSDPPAKPATKAAGGWGKGTPETKAEPPKRGKAKLFPVEEATPEVRHDDDIPF